MRLLRSTEDYNVENEYYGEYESDEASFFERVFSGILSFFGLGG